MNVQLYTLKYTYTLHPKENIPRTHWIGDWWLGPIESGYDGGDKNLTVLEQFIPTVFLIIRNMICSIQNCYVWMGHCILYFL
jgi:hypothetical protein